MTTMTTKTTMTTMITMTTMTTMTTVTTILAMFLFLDRFVSTLPFINWSLQALSQSPAFSPLKDGREQHSPGNFWSDPAFNVVLIEARVGILIIADDQQAVFPPYWQRHHPPGGAGPAIYSLTRKQNIPPKEPSKTTRARKLLHDSFFPYMSLRNGILKIWKWKCTGD